MDGLRAAFAQAGLEGMDPAAGAALFAGNVKLYLKVLGTFAGSIGGHIDKLNDLCTEETIADYAIEVHGVKGSCYGVGATREGDMAKELEFAAKAGDFAKVSSGNGPLTAEIAALAEKFRAVQAIAEGADGGDGRAKKAAPEKAVLLKMLEASRGCDADGLQAALRELEAYDYEAGGDLVRWLGGQVTAFGYDEIRTRLEAEL
jgi:HPt (histidine-containing phosphotransfer) domain-containing protein